MLKYNMNLRNGTAKARMWMVCHVTALTLSLGFSSQAAAIREESVPTASLSPVGMALTGCSTGEINRKSANMNVKFAKEAEEAFNRVEEQAKILEAQKKAEEQAAAREAEAAEASRTVAVPLGNSYEKELLASIIFCEAGNQSFTGQVAVGAVVMNRIASSAYPNTMEEVIYQSGQFSPAGSGWLDQVRSSRGYTESAMQAAEAALAGENPVGGCLYFDQGGYGMQIGAHYFH
ncbi:MAG: cell wall hydrolase [Eubacteriales bacterium]|nr:cell wall hydrolase [Eubacteriales bacterium]